MDLQTLIASHKNGQSYQELADRTNGTVTQPSFQAIATRTATGFPKPETIRGLALALNVPESSIIRAAAESLGLGKDDPRGPRTPQGIADLEEQHSRLLVKLHRTEEERYYWQNHAHTYKHQARKLSKFFQRLNPITRERPYMLTGTGHQYDYMNANEAS